MDIESYRRRKVRDFIESLGMVYCSTWKAFTRELGVEVTEELKLVTDDEWKTHFDNNLCASIILKRKLKVALDNLTIFYILYRVNCIEFS